MQSWRPVATWTCVSFAATGILLFGCAGRTEYVEENVGGGAPTDANPTGAVAGRDATTESGGGPSSLAGAGFVEGLAESSTRASLGGEGGAGQGGARDAGTIDADASEADGAAINRFPCVRPAEITGVPSGYYRCSNGMIHRAAIHACEEREDHPDPGPSGSYALDECTRDADCAASAFGFCEKILDLHPRNACFYGCRVDADCGAGEICVCGMDPVPSLASPAPFGSCLRADCTSDADCLPRFHCATYDTTPACFSFAFSCQVPADDCGGNGDCDGQYCTIEAAAPAGESTPRRCVEPTCALWPQ
jgi:hypothetical protein